MPAGDEARSHQRQRILDAIAELVAKRGYAGTTIERIAKAAGVGMSTFHKHFHDKEECFLAAFDEAIDEADRRATEASDASGEEWADRIEAGLTALLEEIVADPMRARMCLVESLAAGPKAVDRYELAIRRAVPILREGRQLSSAGRKLPEALEETMIGGIAWTVQQRLATGDLAGLKQLMPQVLLIVLAPYLGGATAERTPQARIRS